MVCIIMSTTIPLCGIFGTVSVLVRTVGGGEDWTSQIVPKPGADGNNTITEILGNRDPLAAADGRTDYVILNTEVEFKQGETTKTVQVTILADDMAEPDETVLVYLTQPTGGARIGEGEPDGGKKGFAIIYISQNDLSNGRIGFSEDSKQVAANEDTSPTFTLKLARIEAFFGEVKISWVAKVSETSSQVDDIVLSSQLERTAGTAICPGRRANCFFNISLVNDEVLPTTLLLCALITLWALPVILPVIRTTPLPTLKFLPLYLRANELVIYSSTRYTILRIPQLVILLLEIPLLTMPLLALQVQCQLRNCMPIATMATTVTCLSTSQIVRVKHESEVDARMTAYQQK